MQYSHSLGLFPTNFEAPAILPTYPTLKLDYLRVCRTPSMLSETMLLYGSFVIVSRMFSGTLLYLKEIF